MSQEDSSSLPSEVKLRVFISSVIENLEEERQIAKEAVSNFPVTQPWLFEDTPASTVSPRELYLKKVREADLVIWLVGCKTTQPVIDEIHTCMNEGIGLLAFLLPSGSRDVQTTDLIEEVQDRAKWKEVATSQNLECHIRSALHDEVILHYRSPELLPARISKLQQEHKQSLAGITETWISLGVPETMATALAEDPCVGNVLTTFSPGAYLVIGDQGSGKSLAVARQYQQAVNRSMDDFSHPYPLFAEARNLSGPLADYIDQMSQVYSFDPALGIFIVIDGIDERGVSEANEVIRQAKTYTRSNSKATVILTSRLLPQLDIDKIKGEEIPILDTRQAIELTSKFAQQDVQRFHSDWPPSMREAICTPLFAVMVGTELRQRPEFTMSNRSQLINQLARRECFEAGELSERAYELLKTLALKAVSCGSRVNTDEVCANRYDQKFLADSRLVREYQGKVDFTLAVFREWFAAQTLIENTVQIEEVLPALDRWLIPLRFVMECTDSNLICSLISRVVIHDPGLAGLLLQEYDNRQLESGTDFLAQETPSTAGHKIRQAIEDWKKGLGRLFSAIGPVSPDGEIAPLGIDISDSGFFTRWYIGTEQRSPVGEPPAYLIEPGWSEFIQDPCRHPFVWPWMIARRWLVRSLRDRLEPPSQLQQRFLDFLLGSEAAFGEFAWELWCLFQPESLQQMTSQIGNLASSNSHKLFQFSSPENPAGIILAQKDWQVIEKCLDELMASGQESLSEPWPSADMAPSSEWVWTSYSDQRLLERTNAIFTAALQVYREMIEQWFQAFRHRLRLYQMLPVRLEGFLSVPCRQNVKSVAQCPMLSWRLHVLPAEAETTTEIVLARPNWTLEDVQSYWIEVEQGFSELRPESRTSPWLRFGKEHLDVFDAQPATRLANKWLSEDLRDLGWYDSL